MSRLLWLVAALALLAVGGQALVPPLVDQAVAHAMTPLTGPGSRNTVKVTAVPFWILADGQFDDLTVTGSAWSAGPLTLGSVAVNWRDGAVDVADLVRRRELVPSRQGHMTVRITVDAAALARLLAASGRVSSPTVVVRAHDLVVSGIVHVHGLSGRLTTTGTLAISANRRAIVFQPAAVDGLPLPFRVSVPVFNLDQVNLPVDLALTAVRLAPPHVVVEAATP